MSLVSPLAFNHLLRGETRQTVQSVQSREDEERGASGNGSHREEGDRHGREASGRSVLSNISGRFATMREHDRERTRNIQIQRMTDEAAREREPEAGRTTRVLQDLHRWTARHLPRTTGLNPMSPGAGQSGDLEAQRGDARTTAVEQGASRIASKSRREKEEGATLFGPNLANYFGSGSSTSGAIAASAPSDAAADGNAPASPPNTIPRRPRLGSRGRARGASLSGLGAWCMTSGEGEGDGAKSPAEDAPRKSEAPRPEVAMTEGIELGTLRRWIERSTVGGALEVVGADGADGVRASAGNPSTLCSTLQSYVNVKRNTIRLHATSADPAAHASSHATQPAVPPPSHTLQFEYDSAAPYASVQVFVRASRKHGSWVAWSNMRTSMGCAPHLTDTSGEGAEARHYAQRGPPPHILGWPVHFSHVQKGFGRPLNVPLALHLPLYAPPKGELDAPKAAKEEAQNDVDALAVPLPAHIPETPGLDANRRLDDAVTPAARPVADPLGATFAPRNAEQAHAALPGSAASAVTQEARVSRAAREKSERETLKIAVVVEALDEDKKPLGEPNLQTTYIRLASLPVRSAEEAHSLVHEGSQGEGRDGGRVVDIAMPASGEENARTPSTSHPLLQAAAPEAGAKRAWSVQVEGQEAEIGPHRFQLQELYGLSTRPPAPGQQVGHPHNGTEATEEGAGEADAMPSLGVGDGVEEGTTECLICLSAPPSTLLLPCTHGVCLDCAVQLRDSVKATRETERRRGRRPKRKYACPVCRRVYTNMLHLRAVDEKYFAQASASVG